MTRPKLLLTLLALAATSCDRTPAADPSRPDAYAVQIALEPGAGGSLQRLALPPKALVALRRSDLGDIRLFDSRGKLVPIALLDPRAGDARRSVDVPVYPLLGPASALGASGLSIRIEDNQVARVVTVAPSASSVAGAAASPTAVLLDTRGVRDPATAIVLDAAIPSGKPIPLTLLTSANLKDWQPLADKVLFHPVDGAGLLGGATIALPGVDLSDRYVGISWGNATGVMLKRASVVTSTTAPLERTAIVTAALAMSDPHDLRFDLPDGARPAAIRLAPGSADGVIPVRLYGRNGAEGPWTLLSATVLRAGGGDNLVDLSGSSLTSYRLEADRRTAGFSVAPALTLLFDPVELVVALSGTPPYRLAVGQAAAPPAFLALAEIAPPDQPLKLADLPRASLAAPQGPPLVVTFNSGASDGALEPRKLLLWAALLMGTLILAFAAYRLMRSTATTGSAAKDEPAAPQ